MFFSLLSILILSTAWHIVGTQLIFAKLINEFP